MSSTSEGSDVIPSGFPFESRFVEVLGSKMHYVDVGEGDPILFIHGNPASSYLWRNIIPHVEGQARCIAVDLIGMGESDHPDIPYRYDDQYRYLCAFIEALGIGSNLTLVIHDWGSGLGFRWAHEHAGDTRAIAFMEAMVRTMSYADLPGSLRVGMRLMRTSFFNWLMIGVANVFLRKLLQDLTYARLSPEALTHYHSAYPTIASRKAVRQWPKEVPFDGKPADNHNVVTVYLEWLTRVDIPKLLFHGDDGVAIKAPEVVWCRENLSNLSVVDLGPGKHFLQETHPEKIGQELSAWFRALSEKHRVLAPVPGRSDHERNETPSAQGSITCFRNDPVCEERFRRRLNS
ncbi:MAG: haloalkane dehalogenase [Dehalococcoidia bacterium]|nr:haloalkane dehalogenase [Dehalococcoidia bacterium]